MRAPGVTTLNGNSPFDAAIAGSKAGQAAQSAFAPRTPMPGAMNASQVDKPTGQGPTGYGKTPSAATAGKYLPGVADPNDPAVQKKLADSAAANGTTSSAYNLDTDPIVQKIKALNTQNMGTTVAGAQDTAKGDLIDSGFNLADIIRAHPELASSPIADVLGDPTTALAAQHNPYSVAANLALAHQKAVQVIDQTANDNNLYFSSTHGNQLGDEAHSYLGNVSGAQNTLAQALQALIGNVQGEGTSEAQKLADAYSQARTGAVTNALNSGETFSGYDANGNPQFGGGAGSSLFAPSGVDFSGANALTDPATELANAAGNPVATAAKKAAAKAPANAYLTSPNKRG